MAKKFDLDVTGLSWQDIVNLDPTHMKGISQKSFARATSRLVSAYNKRARRLEYSGMAESSPAYRGLQEQGKTRLSVKGKSWNELMSTYADAKRLLTERSTFSVGGTKKLISQTAERIGHEFGSRDEAKRYWEAIDKLKEIGVGTDKRTSTDVQREVASMMFGENESLEDILQYYEVIEEENAPNAFEENEELFDLGEEYDESDWDW